MKKSKLFYKYMKVFKPYYDDKTNKLRKDAPEEAKEAYRKFQQLLNDFDPLEEMQLPPDVPEDEAE